MSISQDSLSHGPIPPRGTRMLLLSPIAEYCCPLSAITPTPQKQAALNAELLYVRALLRSKGWDACTCRHMAALTQRDLSSTERMRHKFMDPDWNNRFLDRVKSTLGIFSVVALMPLCFTVDSPLVSATVALCAENGKQIWSAQELLGVSGSEFQKQLRSVGSSAGGAAAPSSPANKRGGRKR